MTIDLRLGDCLDIMPTLPDASFDAIITDPPYYATNLKFDNEQKIDFKWLLQESRRVLKQNGVLVTFGNFNLLAELLSYDVFKTFYELVWQKNMAVGFLDAKFRPLRNHEFIGVFTNGLKKSTYNPQKFNFKSSRMKIGEESSISKLPCAKHYGKKSGIRDVWVEDGTRNPQSVIFCHNWDGETVARKIKGETLHPTQKPIALLEYLVRTYTNEGDTVLDFTMGSGTTLVACVNTNRNGVGIEKEREYFDIAQRRVKDAQAQLSLIGMAS